MAVPSTESVVLASGVNIEEKVDQFHGKSLVSLDVSDSVLATDPCPSQSTRASVLSPTSNPPSRSPSSTPSSVDASEGIASSACSKPSCSPSVHTSRSASARSKSTRRSRSASARSNSTRRSERKRSRSIPRLGHYGSKKIFKSAINRVFHEFGNRGRRNTDCRYDRECTRRDCWFLHPNGRRIDEPRRKSRSRRRQRYRSPSHWVPRQRSVSSPRSVCREAVRPNAKTTSSKRSCKSSGISVQSKLPDAVAIKSSISPSGSADAFSCGAKLTSPKHADECEKKPNASNPKVLAFRDFVLQEVDDFTTADETFAKYRAYQHQVIQQMTENLK